MNTCEAALHTTLVLAHVAQNIGESDTASTVSAKKNEAER